MKNRGFTLVEILGVIVVLTLLVVSTYAVVDGISKRNKQSVYKVQIDSILDGAANFATNTRGVYLPNNEVGTTGCADVEIRAGNIPSYNKDNVCRLTIYLSAIVEEGILDENITNPLNDKKIDINNSKVIVTYVTNDKYKTYNSSFNADGTNKFYGNIRYQYQEVLVNE